MTDVRSIITIENHEVISFERGDSSIPELLVLAELFSSLTKDQELELMIDEKTCTPHNRYAE